MRAGVAQGARSIEVARVWTRQIESDVAQRAGF
jgi:hypothetical protein